MYIVNYVQKIVTERVRFMNFVIAIQNLTKLFVCTSRKQTELT